MMHLRAILPALAALVLLLSCGGKDEKKAKSYDSPSDVAVAAYEHLMRGEYEQYLDCVAAYDSIPAGYRAQLVNMLKQANAKAQKERKGVVAVGYDGEVKEGEKPNDKENEMPGASKAFKVVHIDITFGDSTREEIAVPVIRQNGKWRLQ